MIYIKYSELTEKYYLVPKSKKESKVDITDDIKEIVEFEKSKSPSPSEAGDGWINVEDVISFGKNCFYKGFEKCEKDDANCYTAWREESQNLVKTIPNVSGKL